MDLPLHIGTVEKFTVIEFKMPSLMDPIDLQNIGDALYKLVDEQDKRLIILDFEQVQYISSQAIGIILTMNKKLGALKNSKLILCGIGPRLMELLKITRLDKILTIKPTQREAVKTSMILWHPVSPSSKAPLYFALSKECQMLRRRGKMNGLKQDKSDSPEQAPGKIDLPRIERAMREVLLAIGEDPDREGLKKTPSRVAKSYAELMAGLVQNPREHLKTVFHERYDEIVLLRDIPFSSLCEHHLLPFTGRAHVAYLPDGKVVGLSKLARLVEGFARRPQVQERLTTQIADALWEELSPVGAACVIEAVHTCMTMRGVQKHGAVMVTSALRGLFKENPSSRAEILSLMYGTTNPKV